MLQPETVAVVRPTWSVLAAHCKTPIRRLYDRIFTHNPGVCESFSPALQYAGGQQVSLCYSPLLISQTALRTGYRSFRPANALACKSFELLANKDGDKHEIPQ